jgi:hypothetical protein
LDQVLEDREQGELAMRVRADRVGPATEAASAPGQGLRAAEQGPAGAELELEALELVEVVAGQAQAAELEEVGPGPVLERA